MARPIDQEPKAWNLIYMNDFTALMGISVGDALASILLMKGFGLGIGLVFLFSTLGLCTSYFLLKANMPTNFMINYMNYLNSPKKYWSSREVSEVKEDAR